MNVITVLNQKGGVGKTSTCYHLSGTLALRGLGVLLVDNDPQASLTQGFLGPIGMRGLASRSTLAAVYAGDVVDPGQVVRPSGVEGVDLVPGSKLVNAWNHPAPERSDPALQFALREFLFDVRAEARHDIVLIDCPPNLNLCSFAALVAADALVVPLEAEDFGSQGIVDVQESAALVRGGANPSLRLLGYLLTRFTARKSLHRLYESEVRTLYGGEVFAATMPLLSDFPEAIARGVPVALFRPRGAAATAMGLIADELLARLGGAVLPRAAAAKEVV